jgi:hypothetical protein
MGHRVYRRTVTDLPLAGVQLVVPLQVRRFFCRHATGLQRVFAEQFPPLIPVHGRHRLGVSSALRHGGLAVGGRAGVRLTRALGIPGSFRTSVRRVHGAPFPLLQVPRVSGLDAWAWRRGRRCGTMGGALARHLVVERRPARTAPAVAPWRPAQPRVESGGRNRRGSLRQARAGPGCGAAGSGRKASQLPPSSSMAQTHKIVTRFGHEPSLVGMSEVRWVWSSNVCRHRSELQSSV